MADVWWSRNLTSWTQAQDMNVTSGSTQVLAVAADPHGFVSAGSHCNHPAVWTTTNGRLWTTIVLALPPGASSAVLQQVAINGDRVVALGQATKAGGAVLFAELSADGGASWQHRCDVDLSHRNDLDASPGQRPWRRRKSQDHRAGLVRFGRHWHRLHRDSGRPAVRRPAVGKWRVDGCALTCLDATIDL